AAFNGVGANLGAYDTQGQAVAANSSQRLFWARAFGGWGSVDGNDEVGKLKRNSGGVLFGADLPVSRWKLGVLGGYSRSSADVDVRNSDSTSNNYHLGAYAGTQI
ncbi:autotransporter outer membrane beta-barrel domain-containing protein, partial [Neisseriaceae bacterium TC5R-5]|nr:autotransporter outer membrane beta-barrel domain-containing protein [Neisseriaceae bacterium TC5R-5]